MIRSRTLWVMAVLWSALGLLWTVLFETHGVTLWGQETVNVFCFCAALETFRRWSR